MSKEKIWALIVPLSRNWEPDKSEKLLFDESVWDAVVEEASKSGVNTIVFDLLDGIKYESHPELALEGAWSVERMRQEIKRLKELGIQSIPKLNFSTIHDNWLCEYERMVSTPAYYQVCKDLIKEAAEIFDHPKYIHLGMDEEDAKHAKYSDLAVYRQGELLWHDLKFYFDCVREAGSIPWMWSDPCFDYPEEFRKRIKTGEVVLSPWMYNGIYPEHLTPVNSLQAYIDYYAQEPYASMNIKFVEDDPFIVRFMEQALPCVNDGYSVVPCVSTVNRCRYNAIDTFKYFKENADDDLIVGYITSPWYPLIPENKAKILRDICVFGKAKREIYEGYIPKEGEGASDVDMSDSNESATSVY